MRPPGYDRRPKWRAAMLRSALHPQTKLVLLVTLDHMKTDGKVYVDRRTVANALGLAHPQRVSERWSQACKAGFLTLVHKGSHGRHSTYQALIPDGPSVRATRSLEEPQNPDTREEPLVTGKRGRYTYSREQDPATRGLCRSSVERELYGEPGDFPGVDPYAVDQVPNGGNEESRRWTA